MAGTDKSLGTTPIQAGFRTWPGDMEKQGSLWRKDIKKLAAQWSELDERERFAVIQQIGSVLRTILANDVESRMR